jgi:hypothetical protein
MIQCVRCESLSTAIRLIQTHAFHSHEAQFSNFACHSQILLATLNGEKFTFLIKVNKKWARLVNSKLFKIDYKPSQAYWVPQQRLTWEYRILVISVVAATDNKVARVTATP